MFELFNWFGSILGYLLWFLYSIVRNYGVSILLFTIIMKLLMFPFSIKQQRSMASQAKLQKKVKELQAIYGNDKMKLSEETQKLYAKEGASPTGRLPADADPVSNPVRHLLLRALSAAERRALLG